MTEPPRHPGPEPAASGDEGRGAPPSMPRWVKLSAIIVASLVLVALVIVVLGLGDHGPGLHG